MVTFFDVVMDGVDEGNTVGVMYLDFQKAFDMMSHSMYSIKVETLDKRHIDSLNTKLVIDGRELM